MTTAVMTNSEAPYVTPTQEDPANMAALQTWMSLSRIRGQTEAIWILPAFRSRLGLPV
jgi:purine nucleoside permease